MSAPERVEFFSAVLLVSKDPARLAAFYRDVLGVPIEDEEHEGSAKHYGCDLGDIHFAIHPVEDFPDRRCEVGAIKLAFTVFDVHAVVRGLMSKGVEPLYPPRDEGFFISTAVRDPDGNYLELTELCDDWFRHLAERRRNGIDVVARWKARRR